MRKKYLRPLYTLRVVFEQDPNSPLNTWPVAKPIGRVSKGRAIGKVIEMALAKEQRIERAWIEVYRRAHLDVREVDWMIEQYLTGAVPRGVLTPIGRNVDGKPDKVIPLIGEPR
jgi:hypothetical protein